MNAAPCWIASWPPGELVFSPAMGQMAYHRRPILGFSDSAIGRHALLVYSLPLQRQLGSNFRRDMHFVSATTRAIRLVATSPRNTDMRISELRFFNGDQEIVRKPSWRVTASSDPWEAPPAFDNIAASFWTSGDIVRPGKRNKLDRRGLRRKRERQSDRAGPERRPALDVRTARPARSGAWKVRKARYVLLETPARPTVRAEAHDELWRLGIRWILIPGSEFGATNLRDHADEWGILQAGMANDFRLWKLTPPDSRP